ncbi:MAG: hypothetical protein IJT64_03065 [Kiritimatiellae bacterium]|nr:hypothetical protein [Kiritimatiellia bacterium]
MSFSSPWLLLLLFATSALAVLILVPPLRAMLVKLGIVDQPSARRINRKPIPRGGGLSIFVAFLAAAAAWHAATGLYSPWLSAAQYGMFVKAACVIVVVGVLDDALDLKPLLKLAGQIVAALMLYEAGMSIENAIWLDVPPIVDLGLTLAWYIIIINAFNLIDGMDGLASGLALIGSFGLSLCLVGRGLAAKAVPLAILGGACLGFLRYNFNPASVFLGDCGSMFIGLVMATVPLLTGGKTAFVASILSPLLIMGVPLFDTVLAIWRRSMRAAIANEEGKYDISRVIRPDMDHLHHRFLSTGLTQRRAAWALYFVSLVMVAVAVGVSLFSDRTMGIVLVGALIVVAIMVRHLSRVELWDTGQAFLSMYRTPRFAKMLMPMYLALDLVFMVAAWIFSFRLAFPSGGAIRLVSVFPLFLMFTMAAMLATGIYRRVWGKGDARDFAVLAISLFAGWLAAVSFAIILDMRYPGFNRQALIFLFLSSVPIMTMRGIRILVAHFLEASETIRLSSSPTAIRYVAYGAGDNFAAYDAAMRGTIIGRRDGFVAALIDDDPMLRGRLMHGHRVVGSLDDIDHVVASSGATCLLIVCALRPENRERAMAAAARLGLSVREWRCYIEDVLLPGQSAEKSKTPAQRRRSPTRK